MSFEARFLKLSRLAPTPQHDSEFLNPSSSLISQSGTTKTSALSTKVCECKCFFLSKRFVKLLSSHPALDFGQTLLVVILFARFLLSVVTVSGVYRASLLGAILASLAAFAILCIAFLEYPAALS